MDTFHERPSSDTWNLVLESGTEGVVHGFEATASLWTCRWPASVRRIQPGPEIESMAMKGLHFIVFPNRASAERAQSRLTQQDRSERLRSTRLHEDSIDLLLGVDLEGTAAQMAREEDAIRRFAFAFGALLILGLVVDFSGWEGGSGMAATFGLGSLGVIAGTIAVLCAKEDALDAALNAAELELSEGRVLLTIPTDEDTERVADHAASAFGGREIFRA